TLRVLLSGPAAEQLAATLGEEPSLALVGPVGDGESLRQASSADVALHVVASPSSADLASEIRELRSRSEAPLILASYGEPNGIVETGFAVGATDVLTLPQPLETVLFALRKAAMTCGAVETVTVELFDGAMLAAVDCRENLLVVCNREISSLKNVRIGFETLERLGFPRERISLVVNRVGAPWGVVRREIEDALEAEI